MMYVNENGDGGGTTFPTIEEYRKLPCGRCGAVEKLLDAHASPSGYSVVEVVCEACGLTNRWTGNINRDAI